MGFRIQQIRTSIKPFRLHWYPRLSSTNTHAARLRRKGTLFAPAIVLAGHQVAGRGRGGNRWWSDSGTLTVTFVMPVEEHLSVTQVPLVAGLAARSAAAELTGAAGIQLKWPNDLLFEGRKLAGLLCERIGGAELIGIGLNVNTDCAAAPRSLRQRIISLADIAAAPLDMTEALLVLARHLYRYLGERKEWPFARFLHEFDRHHALVGRHVTIADGTEQRIAGECEGIDRLGRLVLRSNGQRRAVVSGSVLEH